uniref:Methylmalonyl-CoA epimerase, mitochondrial n=1 Tax=Auxenochlorella protothecoides TaxID=3075 RepID=A0A1D1ZUX2_AUXPR
MGCMITLLKPCDPLPSLTAKYCMHPDMQACAVSRRMQSTAAVTRLNHLAIAVPDVRAAAAQYQAVLGARVSEPQALPEHGVTVVFVQLENTKLELLEPLGEASPVAKFLEKNPAGGMHHMCLEVCNVKASMAAVSERVRLLSSEPKIGAHGNPVVFMHPKDMVGVLTELEEVPRS